jgi:hypothetical protein
MARPATAAVRLLTGEREPVRLATTANIILQGLKAIDGVMTEVGDRVLVKNQTDARQNGIYTASEGTWYRAADARSARTLQKGTTVHVQEGTVSAAFTYSFQTSDPVIGTDDILITFYLSDSLVSDATAAVDALVDEAALAAAQAAALAGPGYGVNIGSPIDRPSDFTVTGSDMGILHIVTTGLGVTRLVTMPPANAHVGKAISILVPFDQDGIVQFLATPGQATSLISDYTTDQFYLWAGEQITLYATTLRWIILDWKKNPMHLQASAPAADVALPTDQTPVEITGWTTTTAGTYLRRSALALDGGAPVRARLPRRGIYLLEFECFVTFSAAPSSLYAYVNQAGSSVIANRGYVQPIQPSAPTQGVVRLRQVFSNNRITLNLYLLCLGGTAPVLAGTSSSPRIRLTELA